MAAARHPDRDIALRRVRQVLDQLIGTVRQWLTGTARPTAPCFRVGAVEGAAIRVLGRPGRHSPRTIEIGLGYGMSALFTCEGLLTNGGPESRHVVIDPNQDTRFGRCGLQFLEEAGVSSLVEHHAEESQITLPRLLSQGRRFDLAVVDGNHRFNAVFLDLAYLGRLLSPGAIVFLDDYHLPAITRAASFFLTNRGWTLEEISTAEERHHWAVLRTSTTPDTRPFDYFVDF